MSDTNFMSYSDAETVVTGIADKYKTFKGTQAQWDALSLSEKVKYSFADITDDYAGTGVVDAVTNGDMNPVSSNAVYDYIHDDKYDHVSCTGVSGDTASTLLDKLYAKVDKSKITSKSVLAAVYNTGIILYPIRVIVDSRLEFTSTSVAFTPSYARTKSDLIVVQSTGSVIKSIRFKTTAASGTGNSTSWEIGDNSSDDYNGFTFEIWYNGYHQ